MYPAVFLDRVGVIIKNHPTYVRSWDDVEIIPDFYNLAQALDALCE